MQIIITPSVLILIISYAIVPIKSIVIIFLYCLGSLCKAFDLEKKPINK